MEFPWEAENPLECPEFPDFTSSGIPGTPRFVPALEFPNLLSVLELLDFVPIPEFPKFLDLPAWNSCFLSCFRIPGIPRFYLFQNPRIPGTPGFCTCSSIPRIPGFYLLQISWAVPVSRIPRIPGTLNFTCPEFPAFPNFWEFQDYFTCS